MKKTAFVIGTGPSLNDIDMEKLKIMIALLSIGRILLLKIGDLCQNII